MEYGRASQQLGQPRKIPDTVRSHIAQAPEPAPATTNTLYNARGIRSEPEVGTSNHTLEDYQMQLMLLEQQEKRRLMIERRQEQTVGESDGSRLASSDVPPMESKADGENDRPQEVSLTHYTISEDKTATSGQRNMLYAINSDSKPNAARHATAHPGSRQYAEQILAQNGIIPSSLRPEQFATFQNMSPDVRQKMMQTYAANIQLQQEQNLQQSVLEPVIGTKKPSSFSPGTFPVPRIQSLQPRDDTNLSQLGLPGTNNSVQTELLDLPRDEETSSELSSSHEILGHFPPQNPVLGGPRLPITIAKPNAEPASTSSPIKVVPNSSGQPVDHTSATEGVFEDSGATPWTNQPESVNLLQLVLQRNRELEAEIEKLRANKSIPQPEGIAPLNVQFFHRLLDDGNDMVYLSKPDWEVLEEEVILRGRMPISDPKGYVERKGNVAFTVYDCYSVEHQKDDIDQAMRNRQPLPELKPARHEIVLESDEMEKAVTDLFDQWPNFRNHYPEVHEKEILESPFIWWYHYRRSNRIDQLPTAQARLVSTLTRWIEANYATLYDRIDEQFGRGRVSHSSIEYLVHPGDVIISASKGQPLGYVATSRPYGRLKNDPDGRRQGFWDVELRSYAYAGKFLRKDLMISLELGTGSETDENEVDIRSLIAMPLRYASSESRERLIQRAKTFWKLRNARLMSYLGHCETRKYAVRIALSLT